MIKEVISIENAIEVLNRLNETDPKAAMALVETRVPCSEELAEDPEIQVGFSSNGAFQVGVLGIINGLFGITDDGFGSICANFSVQCSKDSTHEGSESENILSECPVCGSSLELGTLLNFERTAQSFNG